MADFTASGVSAAAHQHRRVAACAVAMQALLFGLLLFTLWWHRPASVGVVEAALVLTAHTASSVVLLTLVHRRSGDLALAPLVATTQLLALIGLVLRMRVDADGATLVLTYVVCVSAAVVFFFLGRTLVRPCEDDKDDRQAGRNGRAEKILLVSTGGVDLLK